MAAVAFVHGVGQQVKGPRTLHAEIASALVDGVSLAGGELVSSDVDCVFYGDLFRQPGEYLAPDPLLDVQDLTDTEVELLVAWWERAAATDPAMVAPDAEVLGRSPRLAIAAVRALSRSRFFSGIGERLLLGSLRQVRRYLDEPDIRTAAVRRVLNAVSEETSVVVAHSLGTVVAYEALAGMDMRVTLVTLGSPLGLPHLIFDRLCPTPPGCWPGQVVQWTNVVDTGDIVAAVEDLRPLFGDRVEQVRVHNGPNAHDARPYLTERLTGHAIVRGLRG
jgi:hypothetical protein